MSDEESNIKLRREQMKKKYLEYGIDIFEKHELLEILLYYCIQKKDTNIIAHRLMNKFGTLSGVMDAPYDLIVESGVSENTAFMFKFLTEFMGVYRNDKLQNGSKVVNRDILPQKLINLYLSKNTEMAYLILMDLNLKELYSGIVSHGSIINTELNIPKICELAIHHSAKYAIIAHNHPGGTSLPSQADIIATINLYQTLKYLKVTLIDHFVVAGDDCVSFHDAGIMFKSKEEFMSSSFYNSSLLG